MRGITLVAGYPEYDGNRIFNSAIVIRDGAVLANHRKACLPNYRVFDEKRYFTPGTEATVVELNGVQAGVLVCEDVWDAAPAMQARAAGAQVLLVINASPYEVDKQLQREQEVGRARVGETGIPLVFVNLIGGQDELVFDGNSFVMDAQGKVTLRAPAFTEGMYVVDLDGGRVGHGHPGARRHRAAARPGGERVRRAGAGHARLRGQASFSGRGAGAVRRRGFGADAVHRGRCAGSGPRAFGGHALALHLADEQGRCGAAGANGSRSSTARSPSRACSRRRWPRLKDEFAGRPPDTAEENIQSRCRGVLLMGISNKTGRMLLTTGNKSEMAVGYATLYGDMAGGFAPIKDCSKLLVYRLCAWRNAQSQVIPARVIERPPSAELRLEQKDTDSLPPYEVLDPILEAFIEEDLSVDQIAARGFDRETVGRILDLVKRNEYKRRQAPPGVRVSGRAFGRDWRYPITSGYQIDAERSALAECAPPVLLGHDVA